MASAPTYDLSKVNVGTNDMVQTGVGTFVNKNSLDDNGYQMAVNYNANKDKPGASPMLVTSGASRSTYANNVNTIQGATSNMTQPTPTVPDNSSKGNNGSENTKNADGSTTTLNADGTSSTQNADGSMTNTSKAGVKTNTPNFTGIDPALKAQYDESLKGLDQGIASAKATLDAATATMQNDPAASAAISQIQAKFDQQIAIMKDKNTLLMGSYVKNAARNGGLQYAGDMTTNFLSEEQDKATQRVADLITQETTAVLKAQQAYKDGDIKAFDSATKAYQEASKGKIDAINKLLTETDKVVKEQQAQQKIDAQAGKDVLTKDTKLSTSLANSIADNITKSGITDEKTIRAYIEKMADSAGISNPDVLESAVVKARSALGRTDLLNQNTKDIINNRNNKPASGAKGGGKDGGFTYTGEDVTQYSSLLQNGGTGPNGTTFAGRGDDTYADPYAYIAIYKDWTKNGGTPAGFLKKFPVSNVNPDSYDILPAGLQPKK